MNENSSSIVGRCTDRAASSGLISRSPMMAIAPSSATPVRSSISRGSPPSIIPA